MKITAKGLELRLRKLGVWTRIEYATKKDIIKQIERLYVEGEEPTGVIIELCNEVGSCDDCFKTGILEDFDEKRYWHSAICDCVTDGFIE